MRCPICKGKGEIPSPDKSRFPLAKLRRKAVIDLRSKDYGYRQIQRLLGYKSPRSVSQILGNIKGER